MRAAEVEFAWSENGVGVIRGDDLQRMASCLATMREKIEATEDAAPFN
jgi:hypothetical protein